MTTTRSFLLERNLGSTGLSVRPLGVGTGALGLDPSAGSESARDAIAVETIRCAIASGINYVDTSPSYRDGDSDRRVGLALAGEWRDKVILASKVGTHPARAGDYSASAIEWTAYQNLRALRTDVIDVMLIHDPSDIDTVLGPGGALEALERLKEKGLIRAIGLGVQNHNFLRRAIESQRVDVIQSPYDYNLIRTTAADLLSLAEKHGVGCINASPFQQGLLAGVDPSVIVATRAATQMWAARTADVERATAIWRWSIERDLDLRAMALQFCLKNPVIATTLIGPRTALELQEDIASAKSEISAEHWNKLAEVLPTFPSPAPGGEAATGPYPPEA
jgi:D-threo-aldose 1-dehydrogenase